MGAKKFNDVITLKREQWESFLEINDRLLRKCRELIHTVKELTARNEYLERRLNELEGQMRGELDLKQ